MFRSTAKGCQGLYVNAADIIIYLLILYFLHYSTIFIWEVY